MAGRILGVFGEHLFGTMQRLAAAAESNQLHLYLIGGAVRDCLLGIPSNDIDFVVDGEAIAFARYLEKNWASLSTELLPPEKVVTYPRYGTAKLMFSVPISPGVDVLDLASARSERYPTSGAAPQVTFPGTLEADLSRRDFSVNAMAVEIRPDGEERLIDQHDGERDLAARVLRILHPKSFVDDPARMLRAIRFSVRLEFSFDAETDSLFEEGVRDNFLSRLPRPRLFDEFRKSLEEKNLRPVLERLDQRGLLRQIHPLMKLPDFSRATGSSWQERLRTVFRDVSDAEYRRALLDFGLQPRQAQDIADRSKGFLPRCM